MTDNWTVCTGKPRARDWAIYKNGQLVQDGYSSSTIALQAKDIRAAVDHLPVLGPIPDGIGWKLGVPRDDQRLAELDGNFMFIPGNEPDVVCTLVVYAPGMMHGHRLRRLNEGTGFAMPGEAT